MNRFTNLTLAAVLTLGATATAFGDVQKPDFLFPSYQNGSVIHGLSNNGRYGVASIKTDDGGNTYDIGALLYDLTVTPLQPVKLSSGQSFAEANDVTDDGKTVAGSVNNKPAVCRLVNGNWTWEFMPLPTDKVTVTEHDDHTNQSYTVTYSFETGTIKAITPDGKYAVGSAVSKDNMMIEKGVMWDVENKAIIPLEGCSFLNVFDEDDHESRFLQLSDDGRYILGLNSFAYGDERGDYVLHYIYDRETKKQIFPFYTTVAGFKVPRLKGYDEMEIDYTSSKSLTSNGRYFTGRLTKGYQSYTFLFDVFNDNLQVFDDGVHDDTWGWSVTKDGLVLSGTPAVTPYADALIYYNNYMYPIDALYKDVYGINPRSLGIDNTGKPTLISEDALTVVFVTEKDKSYVVRFHEPLTEAISRINLMSGWKAVPAANTTMTQMADMTITFNNPIDSDGSKFGDIALLDSKGNKVASPKTNGVSIVNMQLNISFNNVKMNAGETYTVVIPEGVCYVKGLPGSTNEKIEVKYVGRADAPVKVKSISPDNHSTLSSLDLNDNPVLVTFDAAVKINGTADNRPIAHVYIDDSDVPAAALNLDVDQNTNTLVIFPSATFFLYKGADYRIDVPAGCVVDLSGAGASEAFSIEYHGSYVPTLGDEIYLFKSTCDDYSPFLFYEGDHGTPTSEYAAMNFTADETPWAVVMDDEFSTDMAFASHSVYTDGRQADDWVATRQLKMPDDIDAYLSFQSQSYRKNKVDRLKVYVYENPMTLYQLTAADIKDIRENGKLVYDEVQSPGATEGTMAGEWTDNIIPLSEYKGKSIYICFVNDNQNQSMVMIDNIFVVKDMSAFLTVTTNNNVVNQPSIAIKGVVSVQSELADYNSISMTLLDAAGKQVSTLSASGINLKAGESYNFEFPQQLPLAVGVENAYTIEYKLDNEEPLTYKGVIRNLAFETEKRVVIEEYTGRDCQFCPLGINMMERLESLYGSKVIPVILHAYNGTDPKGAGILGYASSVFVGSTAAPSARINRRPNATSPMYSDSNGKYHITAADVPGAEKTWLDEVQEELAEPAILDLDIVPIASGMGASYDVKVKSALNLTDQNIRVLGVLLEDGIFDYQTSGIYNLSDPMLGEFGQGGTFGSAQFFYFFNNVARGYWGQSANGTPRLIPSTLEVGKEYNVRIDYQIPQIVQNLGNIKMAVILIDETTGRVINAAVSAPDLTSVDEIIDNGAELAVTKAGSEISVVAPGEAQVAVYTLDGRMLKMVSGNGAFSFSLDGYNGMVIVKAVSGDSAVTEKFMM